jgi:hypothetical protein
MLSIGRFIISIDIFISIGKFIPIEGLGIMPGLSSDGTGMGGAPRILHRENNMLPSLLIHLHSLKNIIKLTIKYIYFMKNIIICRKI